MGLATAAQCATMIGCAPDDAILLAIIPGIESAIVRWLRFDPVKQKNVEYYPINDERQNVTGPLVIDSRNGRAILTPLSYTLGDVLFLRNRPIWVDSDFEIREDFDANAGQSSGTFGTSTILTPGVDYWIDVEGGFHSDVPVSVKGIVYRIGGAWAAIPGSIKVTYNGGYSEYDLSGSSGRRVADIRLATQLGVMWTYKQIAVNMKTALAGYTAGPIMSETLGPYSYTTGSSALYNMNGMLPPMCYELLQPHRSYAGIF